MENEATARKHLNSIEKLGNANEDDPKWRLYREKNWISEDPEVLKLTEKGYDEFELRAANRIMIDAGNKVYLNKCPNCGKLARTPQARQCRHCGANWHGITTAKFQLNSSFQLTNRPFFLTGQITEGHVNKGDFLDLTMIGLKCKPKITAIEYIFQKIEDNTRKEDIALGTDEPSYSRFAIWNHYRGICDPFYIRIVNPMIRATELQIPKSVGSTLTNRQVCEPQTLVKWHTGQQK